MGLFKKKSGSEEIQAIIFIKNRHASGYSYMNRIKTIDGKKCRHKLYKIGMPAYYVDAGNHILEVNAYWMENRKEVSFKHPLKIEIQVYSGHYYALNYNVDKQIFEFEECDPDHYYKD